MMLGRQQDTLRTASFEPRIQLEGVILSEDMKMPSMADVRADVQSLHKLKRVGPAPMHAVFANGISTASLKDPGLLPEALTWNLNLPELFKFSYYAHVDDVPVDLLEDVIWTLEMLIRVLIESTEEQLRGVGYYSPKQTAEVGSYILLSNTRSKLITHLMCRHIDRPEAALPHLKAASEEHIRRMKKMKLNGTPVETNPLLYFHYAAALTFTDQFSPETKEMCENVLKAAEKSTVNYVSIIVQTRMCLSLVLKELDVEPEKQKQHTEATVKWIRKNPKRMISLEQFVRRRNQPAHPVFVALGAAFFDSIPETRTTHEEDNRAAKRCRNCGLDEPQVKLSRCAGCNYIYYCSKDCQKANWKLHKDSCKERARSLAASHELKQSHDPKAREAAEWIKWRDGSHYANTQALIHALGLHRDPSRGRTHIVFRYVKYTPQVSKDIRYWFTVTQAGVFKISDVYRDIDVIMGLNPGEGKKYIAEILQEVDATPGSADHVPIVNLAFGGAHIQPWLTAIATPLSNLRVLPYDPDWRKAINLKTPAAPMLSVRSGAKDVEHVF